ncbi:MAG: 3-hydroxyacyl-CoA dehydrogenase family protein [Planctomycetota bacterium]
MLSRLCVIGAGTMGRGISQVAAISGIATVLCDTQEHALLEARRQIAASVEQGISKGKSPPTARDALAAGLTYSSDAASAARDADIVIEAVPEVAAVKMATFERIGGIVRPACILASNTSSLSITGLAAAASHPDRFIGLHFFNPVPIMSLVEIVRGLETSQATLDAALEFVRRIGKEPIVVNDSPGFATSRLGVALGLEAIRMLEAGVASAQEIDRAMELGYKHPMGPLRLTDLIGLDVRLAIAENLHREVGEQFRPPVLLRNMVRAGRLGKKNGRGFYDWPADDQARR